MPNISVTEIVKTVESGEEEVREFVEENELSEEDLEKLIEGEKASKNRESVKNFLSSKIREKNVEKQLDDFEDDLEGVEELMEKYRIKDEETELSQEQVLRLVGSTVDELVDHLEEKTYSTDKLRELKEAEELVKNRKTAKRAIDEEIKKTRLGEDAEKVAEDAEALEEDIEELESDLDEGEFETETGEDFKQKLKKELQEIDDRMEDEDLEDVAEAIEEKEEQEDEEKEEDIQEEETEEGEEAEKTSEDEEDEEVDEESEQNEGDAEDEDTEGQNDEDAEEEDQEEEDELEKKKSLVRDIVDLELSDEELEEIELEELKNLKDEQERREELIEKLSDKFDEEKLRNSSTSDLEKLASGLKESDGAEEGGEDDGEDEEVDEEQLQKEAQEELDMLMGARNVDEKEGDSGDRMAGFKQKIDDTKNQIRNIIPGSGDEEEQDSSKMDSNSVKQLLDDYKQLEKHKASVKTAHVMKAFLERRLHIDREMTYKELAEHIAENRSSDDMLELAETLKKLHRDQYMGDISIENTDRFIETSKNVVEELK